MEITRGKVLAAQKVVLYGTEGIGKSTFAAKFPEPLFIDTEGSTKHMDVARLPKPLSWSYLLEEVKHIKANPQLCRTLVIDTADWAEQLCSAELCSKNQKSGIEDWGYGKGYVYLSEEFGKLLNLLEDVVANGVNVVLTAHAAMRKVEQPDEIGSFDRWEMKLSKKTAPLVKEWADMILFANYKTHVINVDGQGAQKGKNKAQGGKRVMYATHHPCWDAKNRHDLKDELPFDYAEIAQCFPGMAAAATPATVAAPVAPAQPSQPAQVARTKAPAATAAASAQQQLDVTIEPDTPQTDKKPAPGGVPPALWDLMEPKGITVADIQRVVAHRGYYPLGTDIGNMDPNFVKGVLIGAWDKVLAMALELREDDSIPF